MTLPFSHADFLDVFAAYNEALWPAIVLLWILTIVVLLLWMSRRPGGGRPVMGLLAVHWAWSAVAYHWMFFRRINPAAGLFAGLFLAQAIGFAWLARAGERLPSRLDRSPRTVLGLGLIAYSVAYPLLGLASGLEYPRMPIFAVPCPTTILTAGILLLVDGSPRFVSIIPIAWAGVGASAAFVLGITADLALIAAGTLLALHTLTAPKHPGTEAPKHLNHV